MTERSTLLSRIQAEEWYQSIPLGDDLHTEGETGTSESDKLAMLDLPDSLTGVSVLDIGCNEGFYSFEFEKRGASPILAIDQHPAAVRKFGLVREWLRSSVRFRDCDFFDLRASEVGTFDVVLFLAVFHHVRYPLLALDRLHELTADTLFFEYVEAIPREHDDQAVLVRRNAKKPGRFQMLPTRRYLEDVLTRAGFGSIERIGVHRWKKLREKHGCPGYDQQRVLLKVKK